MKKANFFWVSYADLMTSLFFVMLVLSAISFVLFEAEKGKYEDIIKELNAKDAIIKVQAEKYRIIESVEQNLEPLKKDGDLFVYEQEYKRYKLAFDIQFAEGKVGINRNDVLNFEIAEEKIDKVGKKLLQTVEGLIEKRRKEPEKYASISYLIVVAGSASKLPGDDSDKNYLYSYNRAYNLYKYWRDELGIDFNARKYHGFIEFQIAGNGEGGIGRFPRDAQQGFKNERRNQRFLINVIPKIGEL